MTTKHTPGPWTAHEIDNGRYSIVHNGPIAYCGDTSASPDDGRANAHLIAAAPDLLAALEMMVERMERTRREENMLDALITNRARAAIAKAKVQS